MLEPHDFQLGKDTRGEPRSDAGQRQPNNLVSVKRHELPNAFDVHLIGVADNDSNSALLCALEPMSLDHLHQSACDAMENLVDHLDAVTVALGQALQQHRLKQSLLGAGHGDCSAERSQPHQVSFWARERLSKSSSKFDDRRDIAGHQHFETEPVEPGKTEPRRVGRIAGGVKGVDIARWDCRAHRGA